LKSPVATGFQPVVQIEVMTSPSLVKHRKIADGISDAAVGEHSRLGLFHDELGADLVAERVEAMRAHRGRLIGYPQAAFVQIRMFVIAECAS
jgi:hypothetical protein